MSVRRFTSLAAVSCIYDKIVENKHPTSKLSSPSTVKGHKAGTAAQTDTRTNRGNNFAGVTRSLLMAFFQHVALSGNEIYTFCLDFHTDRKVFPKESCLINALNMTN